MLPAYLIPSLISLGTTGVNYLGAKANDHRHQQDLQRIMELLSPGGISADTNKLFEAFKSSPMYGALRARALTGANALGNAINNRAFRSGLGNSGISAVAQPLAANSFQNQFQQIDADMFSKALGEVSQNRKMQAAYLAGSPSQSPFGSSLGSAFEFLGPYLRNLMTQGNNPRQYSGQAMQDYSDYSNALKTNPLSYGP